MSAVDDKIERGAGKLEELSRKAARAGGVKAKLAEPLAEDAEFLRKLKPSLIAARAKGEAPTGGTPPPPKAPTGPQVERPKAKKPKSGGGGMSPWLVIGAALGVGYVLAKAIDWRGHAHPRR
jgi:hypothetical protein